MSRVSVTRSAVSWGGTAYLELMQRQTSSKLAALLLLASSLLGCTGNILGERNGEPESVQGDVETTSLPQAEIDPGPSYLRRLTNAEYNATLHDLLAEDGDVLDRAASFDFVPDTRVLGFESNATNVSMSRAVFERYLDAAQSISSDVVASAATSERVLGCAEPTSECLQSFIVNFGLRAYRRPLESEEISELTALANTAVGAAQGARMVLQHFLLSPNFLFRVEQGAPDSEHPTLLKLTGYELATRLSYLLLGTTPAAELLERAGAGELDTAAAVRSVASEMLNDPRAKLALRRFYEQWLHLDRLAKLAPDPALFPEFGVELAASMREETDRLLDRFLWDPGRNFLDLISSPETTIDDRLAEFYGVPASGDWQTTTLPPELGRSGLLGHASLLAITSRADRTSVVLRGKYVREALLCDELPAPPANVAKLADAQPGQSEREQMEAHASDPSCAGCHKLMDPIGAGLSHFDAIGKFRELDELGQPIDTSGTIDGYPELADASFDGEPALGAKLRALPAWSQCVVTQLFRHAFARLEQPSDQALLSSALGSFAASNYAFLELVLAFVESDAFRYRQPKEVEGAWE